MKKVIIAFIAGALVMVSGQAIANTVSQIGNKVDSEAAVYVNGERVSDAIIIKGKSYFPGRDVVEKMGGTVEWKGSEGIIITAEKDDDKLLSLAKANVKSTKDIISDIESSLAKYKEDIIDSSGVYKEFLTEHIAKLENELKQNQEKLAQYEKEIQELESTK